MIAAVGVLAESHREALADGGAREPDLSDAIDTATTLAGTGSMLIVATALDTAGAGFDEAVLRAVRRHDVVFLLIEDAFEREPPAGDYPFASDEGRGGWLRIGRDRLPPPDRIGALRRLGAGALRYPAADSPARSAALLETIDG